MAVVAIIFFAVITLWVVAVALKVGARQTGLLNRLIYGLGTGILLIVTVILLIFVVLFMLAFFYA